MKTNKMIRKMCTIISIVIMLTMTLVTPVFAVIPNYSISDTPVGIFQIAPETSSNDLGTLFRSAIVREKDKVEYKTIDNIMTKYKYYKVSDYVDDTNKMYTGYYYNKEEDVKITIRMKLISYGGRDQEVWFLPPQINEEFLLYGENYKLTMLYDEIPSPTNII